MFSVCCEGKRCSLYIYTAESGTAALHGIQLRHGPQVPDSAALQQLALCLSYSEAGHMPAVSQHVVDVV